MAKKIPQPTNPPRERAFLAGVDLFREKNFLTLEDSLEELALLSDASGLDVVGELTQKLDRPHVKTYIGPGKVDELKMLVEETVSQVVIFDDELPRATSVSSRSRSGGMYGCWTALRPSSKSSPSMPTPVKACCRWSWPLVEIGLESQLFSENAVSFFPPGIRSEVFESLLAFVLELANQGREGKPVGAIFVVGDHEKVLTLSSQLVFNPFHGHPEEALNINEPQMRESLKEFSSIDGAFIIREDGIVLAAGRYLNVGYHGEALPQGLGTVTRRLQRSRKSQTR